MPRTSQRLRLSASSRRLYAGTSGWAYPTWKPEFYPAGTPAKRFLEFYASKLTSVEVNYTFRALPTAKMLEGWLAATPENFRFSFKAPQRITHFRRLQDCADDVAQFISALEPVRQAGKLGLLLFQLPPNFKADAERLTNFLATPAFRTPNAPAIAFEFRHESWFSDEIYTILREHNAALCIAESDDLAYARGSYRDGLHLLTDCAEAVAIRRRSLMRSPSVLLRLPRSVTSTCTSSTKMNRPARSMRLRSSNALTRVGADGDSRRPKPLRVMPRIFVRGVF